MLESKLKGIRVPKSESFKIGSDVYVPYYKIIDIFSKRDSVIAKFDRDNFIVHPVKGKLYLYPGSVTRVRG